MGKNLRQAVCASNECLTIGPQAALEVMREAEADAAQLDLMAGALAAVSAFDPTSWTLQRFRLWRDLRPDLLGEGRQLFMVGYVALP